MCALFTLTRLHLQKHLWQELSKSLPAATQAHALQLTARALKTLQNTSRGSSTERVLTKRAKTTTRKQQQAGEHPARRPPGTAHHCVRPKHNPWSATAHRLRQQPPMPHSAPAATKPSPHTPLRAVGTPVAPSALHKLSYLAPRTGGGSPVPAPAITLLHAETFSCTRNELLASLRHAMR